MKKIINYCINSKGFGFKVLPLSFLLSLIYVGLLCIFLLPSTLLLPDINTYCSNIANNISIKKIELHPDLILEKTFLEIYILQLLSHLTELKIQTSYTVPELHKIIKNSIYFGFIPATSFLFCILTTFTYLGVWLLTLVFGKYFNKHLSNSTWGRIASIPTTLIMPIFFTISLYFFKISLMHATIICLLIALFIAVYIKKHHNF